MKKVYISVTILQTLEVEDNVTQEELDAIQAQYQNGLFFACNSDDELYPNDVEVELIEE